MESQQVANSGFLSQPDENTIQALFNLKDNNNFKVVLNWMLSSSGDVDHILRTVEPHSTLHRAQGASSVLLAFLSHSSSTDEVMARIKRHSAGVYFPGENQKEVPSINI